MTTASALKQLNDLKNILTVLDTAHFIERYSIYNWVEDARAMVLADTLTLAGKYYAGNKSAMAFNRSAEVIPTYIYNSKPALSISFGTKTLTLNVSDLNGEYCHGFVMEKKIDDGAYVEFYNYDKSVSMTCPDTLDLGSVKKVRYRVRTKMPDGSLSAYSDETGFDVSNGNAIKFGTVSISNVGWNPVFFREPYTEIPSIILGSPTNKNSPTYLVSRAKLVNYATQFNIQIAPWSYQKVSSLSNAETVPYLIMKPGSYDFGGLQAQAGKTLISPLAWTTVTFATPFENDPVVFVTQLNSYSTFATTVRVRNVTKTGFEARLQKESGITTTLLGENVSYFAVTPGKGEIDHRKIIVGKTAKNAVGSVYSSIQYGDSIPEPLFIAQMQTCNDDTVTAYLRTLYLSSKYSTVVKQREKSTGMTSMSAETAAWLVIDPTTYIDAVESPQLEGFDIYPNPVSDFIYLDRSFSGMNKLDIYNIFGTLVKSFSTPGNILDVKDLPAGYYLLRTAKHGSRKFIKL